jgi:hypothetical protein
VETPLASNSPHDHMILRVDLVGSHGRWNGVIPQRKPAPRERTTEVAFGRTVADKPVTMPEAVRRRLERMEHEALVTVAERLIEEILTTGQVMVGGGGGGGGGGRKVRGASGRAGSGVKQQASVTHVEHGDGVVGEAASGAGKVAGRRRLLSDSVELHSLVHLNPLQVTPPPVSSCAAALSNHLPCEPDRG